MSRMLLQDFRNSYNTKTLAMKLKPIGRKKTTEKLMTSKKIRRKCGRHCREGEETKFDII